jgi:hypothetical protein
MSVSSPGFLRWEGDPVTVDHHSTLPQLVPATTRLAPMIHHVVTGKTIDHIKPGESNINILASRGYYFVDKTLTINRFLTGPSYQLVLRPRRCGKSHAISLLRLVLISLSLFYLMALQSIS